MVIRYVLCTYSVIMQHNNLQYNFIICVTVEMRLENIMKTTDNDNQTFQQSYSMFSSTIHLNGLQLIQIVLVNHVK